MVDEICKICGKEIRKRGLGMHLKKHSMSLKEYYDKFYKKDDEGFCQTCKKDTEFLGINKGYRKFCSSKCNDSLENFKNTLTPEKWKKIHEKTKQTKLEKYGDEFYLNSEKAAKTHYEKSECERLKIIEKRKTTNLKNFGYENPMQNPETRNKAKQTCLERFGVDNANKSKEIQDKTIQTNLEKYGCERPTQNLKIQQKVKETNLKNFGYENPFQNSEIKEKSRQTNLEKYGEESFSKTDDFKNILKEYYDNKRQNYLEEFCKNNNLILQNHNSLEIAFVCNKCDKEFIISHQQFYLRSKNNKEICIHCNPLYQNVETSQLEKEIFEFVKENYHNTIKENDRTVLKLELDIYLPESNLAFEFNGLYWHSSDHKKFYYHKHKTQLCEDKGIHLIHIYEDDWMFKSNIVESNILKLLNVSPILYPNNYIVKEISQEIASNFLENNSIQFDKDFSKSFGLFSNNSLVYVLTLNKNKINNISETIKYTVKNAFQIVFNNLKEILSYDSYKLILDRSWHKTQNTFGEFRFNKYIKEKCFYIINNKREEFIQDNNDNERILKIYNSGYLEYIWSREENKNA